MATQHVVQHLRFLEHALLRIVRPHPLAGHVGPVRLDHAAVGAEATVAADGRRHADLAVVRRRARRPGAARRLRRDVLRRRVLRQQRRLPLAAHTRSVCRGLGVFRGDVRAGERARAGVHLLRVPADDQRDPGERRRLPVDATEPGAGQGGATVRRHRAHRLPLLGAGDRRQTRRARRREDTGDFVRLARRPRAADQLRTESGPVHVDDDRVQEADTESVERLRLPEPETGAADFRLRLRVQHEFGLFPSRWQHEARAHVQGNPKQPDQQQEQLEATDAGLTTRGGHLNGDSNGSSTSCGTFSLVHRGYDRR